VPVSSGDPSLMLVDLPQPGGAVRAFRESAYVNGLRQTATLGGAVAGLGATVERSGAALGRSAYRVDRLSEAGVRRVRRVIRRQRIVTAAPGSIFGAIGRRARARCVFAWVDDIRKGRTGRSSRAFRAKPTPASHIAAPTPRSTTRRRSKA
jgi:hypothetical protein